jgi:acyl dehydratase
MADSFEFPVDLTSIMLFASAIGETNPIYYDQQYAEQTALGGVIAPPSFLMAASHWNPEYPLRGVRKIPPPPPREETAGSTAQGGGGAGLTRLLHGEQRYEYHAPVRPGMRLTVSTRPGRVWEKEGRRGGTMQFRETISEYRDEGGELVVTATGVSIVTGKAVEG